jgi:hypothetical protein
MSLEGNTYNLESGTGQAITKENGMESLPIWVQWLTAIATLATPITVVIAFYRKEDREKAIEAFYSEVVDFCEEHPGRTYKMFPVGSKQVGYGEELVKRERLIRVHMGREYGYRTPMMI